MKNYNTFISLVAIVLLCILSALLFVYHEGLIRKADASINNGFFIGSNAHAEDIYLKDSGIGMIQPLTAGPRTTADYDRWLQTASASGMTMVRSSIAFASIATASANQSTWNWTDLDLWVNKVKGAGLEPLMIVAFSTPWLADPLDATATSGAKLQFANEFGTFAGAMAARYAGRVTYYEVWNEPSLATFWNWSRSEFTQVLAEASYKIKLADPTAKVMYDVHALDSMINPALTYNGQGGFSAQMLVATVTRSDNTSVQGVDAVDIIAGHSYPDRTSDIPEDLLAGRYTMAHFYNYMDAYLRSKYGTTRGNKKFHHTETGWSSRASSFSSRWVSEAKAATLIARSIVNLMSSPNVQSFIQYDISDDGTDTTQFEQNYGLTAFTPDGSGNLVAKPALTAMHTVSTALDGTNFVSTTSAVITTDEKNWTYEFANLTSGRKVWAVVLANALTPLGSLDTSTTSTVDVSPSTSIVTIKQLDGTVSNATVTSGNVTVVTSENMQFVMEPATISAVSAASSSAGGTITWTTNEATSTQINYGLTTSYGTTTTEADTSTRVTSHSVTLTGLASCTTYHYRVRGKHASDAESIGSDNTFTTTGCTGSAPILAETDSSIATASGGSVSLQSGGLGIALTIPSGFAGSNAEFQIKQLTKASVLTTTSTPTGYSAIGSYVYELKALTSPTTALSSFTSPITVAISYNTADITGIDESTLKIYRWDGSSWNLLSGCSVNVTTQTVSCTTSAFSTFMLVGQAIVVTSSSSSSSNSNSSNSTTGTPTCSDTTPGSKLPWLYSAIPKNSESIELYFTENDDPVDHYVVQYGTSPGNYQYGVSNIGKKGLRMYVISALKPATTYYFRVRAGNGCATGGWSNEIKAKTTSSLTTGFLDVTSSELSIVKKTEPTIEKKTVTSFNSTSQPTPQPTIIVIDEEKATETSTYTVNIVVVNKKKEPVEGASVILHSIPKYGETNKKGIATFSNVEKGDHEVLISYNNFEGKQNVNLQGNVQEFKLDVVVDEKWILLNPLSLTVIGSLIAIIVILAFFIIILRNQKSSLPLSRFAV